MTAHRCPWWWLFFIFWRSAHWEQSSSSFGVEYGNKLEWGWAQLGGSHDLDEQGVIYCGKYFIWKKWMIFLILKCVAIFFFFFQRFWKSSHKFPKVAECHVLAHLVDVFVTEVGKKIFFGKPPHKNFFSPKFFLTDVFLPDLPISLKMDQFWWVLFRHMFLRVLITNLMSEMQNSN